MLDHLCNLFPKQNKIKIINESLTTLLIEFSSFFFFFFKRNAMAYGASSVAQMAKNPPAMQETQYIQDQSVCQDDTLEEEMTTLSSVLSWKIP